MKQWAIVSLFGHVTYAGFVEPDPDFPQMVRITIPETAAVPGWSKTVGQTAIYSIDPVTEETARLTAESLRAAPSLVYDVRQHIQRQMALNTPESQLDPTVDFDMEGVDLDEDQWG